MPDARPTAHWPLLAAAALFVLLTAALAAAALARHPGVWVYALDDAYIHMAVAKNLALHGFWGVSAEGFSAATSSLLWPALLAGAYALFGVNQWAPALLNLVLGLALLALVHLHGLRRGWSSRALFGLLAALVLCVPMAPLVLVGMEHLLQAALAVGFVLAVADSRREGTAASALLVLAALNVATRFEALFLVGLGAVFLAGRGQWARALGVLVAGALPVGAFAAYSLSQGWWALPNPVLLKGNAPDLSGARGWAETLGYAAYRRLIFTPALLFLLLGSLALLARRLRGDSVWAARDVTLALFALTTVLHLQFAAVGQLFRYEAYLVALGLVALLPEAPRALTEADWLRLDRRRWAASAAGLALVALCGVPLAVRAVTAHAVAPLATANIHEQQVQMGRFLGEHYAGRAVVLNDVGATNYFAEVRCLDLMGLASLEPARLRRHGGWDRAAVERLASERGAEVAMVYEPWYAGIGGLPESWVAVEDWTITGNVACGWPTVTIYAVGEDSEQLRRRLAAFELPPGTRREAR